ncbi:DUF4870 domain-containing protein [Flavobacteriaceae bacterium F08102]|nr:DUF4870 domain-containing protein [Flavobacteriaceae bacterium F08102]
MSTQRENNTSLLIHLSAFFGLIFPFGSIIGPLVMWTTHKDRSERYDELGKDAINFNMSFTMYMFILGMGILPFAFKQVISQIRHFNDFNSFDFQLNFDGLFGILSIGSLIGIIGFSRFILTIVAAAKASRGERYQYPLTIRFLK